MRVAFSDPQGPRLVRALRYVPPALLFVLACVGLWEAETAVFVALLAFALAHLAGMVNLRQAHTRSAELTCGPGHVTITKAGTRSQKIEARSIVGGTTARTSKGILFTLAHAKRDQPILFEVESEADAEKVRAALGIGHGGFGTVGWRTVPSTAQKSGFVGDLLTFLMATTIAMLGLFASAEAAGMAALMGAQFGLITVALGLIGKFGRPTPPSVEMTAGGLKILTKQGWFTLPYDHVLGVEEGPGVLYFRVPPPYNLVEVETAGNLRGTGLGAADRDALVKQLMSASARARGLGPQKNDVTGRLDVLRRNGESARDWLARLDMTGRMLESTVAGYRGHTLDAEDLWVILEDPEAEPELRAAAARVLRHLGKPETRVRIDAAVAAVRDETTNKKLRIAIRDDVDGASHELAMLEAQEMGASPQNWARPMAMR